MRTLIKNCKLFKVAYYSFCTMRALICACAAQGTRKLYVHAKSREPAEEIPRAQKQNGGSRQNFLVFQVGSRGVLTVASLYLGLINKKNVLSNGCHSLTALKPLKSCDFLCQMPEHEGSMHSPVGARARWNPDFPETSRRNGLLAEGCNNYFLSLNFSKSSCTTYVQIFAVHRKNYQRLL